MSKRKISLYPPPLEGKRESEINAETQQNVEKQFGAFYMTMPTQAIAEAGSPQWKVPRRTTSTGRMPKLEPLPGFTDNQTMRKTEPYQEKIAASQISKPTKLPEVKKSTQSLSAVAPSRSGIDSIRTVVPEEPMVEDEITEAAEESSVSEHKLPVIKNFLLLDPSVFEDITDPLEMVQLVRQCPQIGFLYMIHPVSRSSIHFTPYKLKIVCFDKINKKDFFTISPRGVMQIRGKEASFTPLDQWVQEYQHYLLLRKKRTFFKYRMWKAFHVWRKTIRTEKINLCYHELGLNLFILNPPLREALLNLMDACTVIEGEQIMEVAPQRTYTLDEFVEEQTGRMEQQKQKMLKMKETWKNTVREACRQALLAKLFVPDDMVDDYPEMANAPEKKTYAEQANKRNYCQRLTRFIRLVDYLILNQKLHIVKNSCAYLGSILSQKLEYYSQPESTKSETVSPDIKLSDVSNTKNKSQTDVTVPLFTISLTLKDKRLDFVPDNSLFKSQVMDLIQLAKEMARSLSNFTSDIYFSSFTRPIINKHIEENVTDAGPKIFDVFRDHAQFQAILKDIDHTLTEAFQLAHQFAATLNHIKTFYLSNERLNLVQFNKSEEQQDVQFFADALSTYTKQKEAVEAVPTMKYLGLLLINLVEFKKMILPSPLKCLTVVNEMLPTRARHVLDTVFAEIQAAQVQMERTPQTTEEFVDHIVFVDEFQNRVESVEQTADMLSKLYELIDKYKVPTPPEDFALFSTLAQSFYSVRILLEKCIADRDLNIDKFCASVEKDIEDMDIDLLGLKEECDNPLILDYSTDPAQANVILTDLQLRMDEYQKQANMYKTYQKNFKVEVSDFQRLESIQMDLLLKRQLWENLKSWDEIVQQWTSMDFNTLDPEVVTTTTMKYVKAVVQLEKGLPPNSVVDVLRQEVESMRELLQGITDLRNPCLKPRHWENVEKAMKVNFAETPLSLGLLKSLDISSFREELQIISGQASSEFSLEGMLKRIEDEWKMMEFAVLPYRDAKDVFILGSTEEVQVLLDDSNVTIGTILSSRHVGPIRNRVEEWERQLDLFGKTLDEWLTCQRSWLYLESIFTAPDIQRQLPAEAKMFSQVDKTWKDIMRRVARMPLAIHAGSQPGMIEALQNNNALLDQIMKCLEAYLESKRMVFPRFYFLSNEELLEILAQTRNPLAVQPHLRKCFDAIATLEFSVEDEGESQRTMEILAMNSPEGEKVVLTKGLKARGNVEDWLGKVEEAMFASLKKCMKVALVDYEEKTREEWVIADHPSQVVLTISQVMWCKDVTQLFIDPKKVYENLKQFELESFGELNKLAALVRGFLAPLHRAILCALITLDVHARDIISGLVQEKIKSDEDFTWQRQLRYYWDIDVDTCTVRMSNSLYFYAYEYLGASPRLVITPLTDRCYLCLMGALQLNLGGAPAGPAGTGKTESTKDLAKSLATQCVVFNCSEGMDYLMMGKFFSGVAQSGAWCCFDEFNRIDIEVLSVIAQQLITIRYAKVNKMTRFSFEGREIRLIHTCAVFITMNPGYAGRTELPDNLKALFRPISMMVPDYALIAEVILYSEGFESSRILARKMTQMYKLCSEQLSQQDHYDFGMRAVKSVLVMAGSLKRENPDKSEALVLLRALRDSNLPKFLAHDAVLFQAILQDLFPGIEIPEEDIGALDEVINKVIKNRSFQPHPSLIKKIVQLYETMIVRHGVMLVGPTGGGKTVCYEILRDSLSMLSIRGIKHPMFKTVHVDVLNPKSVSMGELYGEVNKLTMEWKDGLLGLIVRNAVNVVDSDHRWIVCDGPVDAVWIENMNSVLDDNKLLCLANSERIKLTPWIHMMFEVQDLAQASPATVSRCGMVYMDPQEMRWKPYVQTWLARIKNSTNVFVSTYLSNLFDNYLDDGLFYLSRNCIQIVAQVDFSKVATICYLLEALLVTTNTLDLKMDYARLSTILCQSFIFSYLWATGGNLIEASQEIIEEFIREQFEDNSDARLPAGMDLWNLYIDFEKQRMDMWDKLVPAFRFNHELPFFEILVPTVDTVRYGYIMEKLLAVERPVLYTGTTGVGKSVVARDKLTSIMDSENYVPIFINFSAQTSSIRTQEMIETKLEKKRKNIIGAPQGKRVIIFVDDVNMPKLDTYGSQPPIELLRQYLDFKGFYDRDKLFWKEIQDVTLCSACAPPGGGRNPVTPRFFRHFSMLSISTPTEDRLKSIFKAIVNGFLADFTQNVRERGDAVVNAAVEIYVRMSTDLLPTPAKSHYVFNLRDLSKCVQGILQANPSILRESTHLFRLFCHESQRVFHDRLINNEDKNYFYEMLSQLAGRYFNESVLPSMFVEQPIIFGDFMKLNVPREDKIYEDIVSMDKLKSVLQDYLEDFNMSTSKEMRLVFFLDAIEHISRIARILRQDRGNALLVGVGGTGKQSLTRLASHIAESWCFQIELKRGYDYGAFHDDLKKLYDSAGVANKPTVFLFTDTQIVIEEFLEDVNNMLNSGEVPNLFAPDEYERAIIGTRPAAKELGIPEGDRDAIYNLFINRTRDNLHIVLCMSPVGDAFRSRCRMFPSLVNSCTIDWFTEWPQEALLGVANMRFKTIELGDDSEQLRNSLPKACVYVHQSVSLMAEKFYTELRRHYYTTPTSYLELISLYQTIFNDKRVQIEMAKRRIQNGLTKLQETNEIVAVMRVELTALTPILKEKQVATNLLMVQLEEDQEKADQVRRVVQEDEAVAKVKAEETQAIAVDAQHDLDVALPALEAAVKALDALDKSDIAEIRVFNKPPEMVQTVMEAVCILFASKTDWATAKSLLGDPNFLRRLYDYDKDHIPDSIINKLKKYIENVNFVPEIVAKTSKACRSLCMWVRATDMYAKVFRTVAPKKARLELANTELEQVMAVLREKQKALKGVEDQIAALKKMYTDSVQEKENLEYGISQTAGRLGRASKLTTGLANEQIRWKESVSKFQEELDHVVGNVFVSTACVAYYGAFTSLYREELVELWVENCMQLKIPISEDYSLISVMANPFEIRQWNADGLPKDSVSTENAILVKTARRWPLMIDPQDQANRWIRNMEAPMKLKLMKLTDNNFLRTLENCIRVGVPVLLEDLGETLDPAIEPLLLKQTFISGGRLLIRLGDSDVEYDKNFRFYMTTKMSNPHYLPEICIKVTIINFTVTRKGLEDQLLSDVVQIERPELEVLRNKLIVQINSDRNQLNAIEDKILRLLFLSEGNILDDEELLKTLDDSKITSTEITSRLVEAEKTESMISEAREKYRSVAARGSILYFVVAELAEIDPMYQFSLKYFKQLFNSCIESSPPSDDLQIRLQILLSQTTLAVYMNIARGLFERHKLIYSLMLCSEIMLFEEEISATEWSYFLRGPSIKKKYSKKPDVSFITDALWEDCCALEESLPAFTGFTDDLTYVHTTIVLKDIKLALNVPKHEEYTTVKLTFDPSDPEQRGFWNERLSDLQKLIVIKIFHEEMLVQAITEFVSKNLGRQFVESPKADMGTLYEDTSKITPLVFILSQGSDPMGAFQRFAKEKNFQEKVQAISLGQGQGPLAEKLISAASRLGHWIFLQNCHLAASWMLNMENMIKHINENPHEIHEEFRLYLSSMPDKSFPVTVLQNSVKVTNEPPKGLRANMKRAFQEITHSFFEDHALQSDWRRMILGIVMFQAVIQERKKFGPLGWNIQYEFNDSDRECALLTLEIFCKDDFIRWDALEYITAQITYGGRVTDVWDQRTLETIQKTFFSPHTLALDYKFSTSGTYFAPDYDTLDEYQLYIEELPIIDYPEIFGMHENANLVFQIQETQTLITTILSVQPRTGVAGVGKSNDEIVYELAQSVLDRLVDHLDLHEAKEELFEMDEKGRQNSLTIVLTQEVERFNKLISIIKISVKNLQKAVKGFLVMSEQLEEIYNSFLDNRVPLYFSKYAYPSLKTFGSWISDLILRIQFMENWMMHGLPKSYWLPGFYFPQGFLTAVLQNHARKYNLPIDQLTFQYKVLPVVILQTFFAPDAEPEVKKDMLERLENLSDPDDGVLMHGLFLDASRFDLQKMVLVDPLHGEMNPPLPVMHIIPSDNYVISDKDYNCPLYKTSARAGTLSTTGHSTNFVVPIQLPSKHSQDYWITKGAALLCQLSD